MLTVDTSAMVSFVDDRQPFHREIRAAIEHDPGPILLPVGILSELTYVMDRRAGPAATRAVLDDIATGALTLDCGEEDLPRIRELLERYGDLDLGYADACVIACAERNGGMVVSIDPRDFGVVAREGTIRLVPS